MRRTKNATRHSSCRVSALTHMGYLEVGAETRQQLLDYAQSEGNLDWNDDKVASRVGEMLALVGATTEYQFG